MTSPRTTLVRLASGVTVAVLALAACGGTDGGAAPTQTTTSSVTPSETATSPTPEPSDSATESSSASPSATTSSPSDPPSESPSETPTTKPVKVKVTIKAGEVKTGSLEVPALAGDLVRLTLKTDVVDELHVHGVEETFPLEVGKNSLEFQVPADLAPGVYEVETHDAALLLFNLVVS